MIKMEIEEEMNIFIEGNIIENAMEALKEKLEKLYPEAMEEFIYGSSIKKQINIIRNEFRTLRTHLQFQYPEAYEKIMSHLQKELEEIQEC